jgi:hypothetical protein
MKRLILILVCVLLGATNAFGQTVKGSIHLTKLESPEKFIDVTTGAIGATGDAKGLILTEVTKLNPAVDLKDPHSAFLIHVVVWTEATMSAETQRDINAGNAALSAAKDSLTTAQDAVITAAASANRAALDQAVEAARQKVNAAQEAVTTLEAGAKNEQTVKSSRWYVVAPTAPFTGNRLFGADHLWIVSVHLNLSATVLDEVKPVYEVVSTAKAPANFANLLALAKLFPGVATRFDARSEPVSAIGVKAFDVPSTSDISIKATRQDQNGPEQQLGDPVTFDNEGRTRWDASVAVPIRGTDDLNTDTTDGSSTPKTVSKAVAFGLLNLYLQPVDIKASGLRRVPAAIFGVGLNTGDLIIGASWGPFMANFYGGAVFVRKDNKYTSKPDWQFGVNVPVQWFIKNAK